MHLTDEQLNEYLDHEADDRVQIELHVTACEECSARLMALQNLFSEIESLPEVKLSPEFSEALLSGTARFKQSPVQPAALPRSLTLTVTLQAVLTIVAILIASPFVTQFISGNVPRFSFPSLMDVFLQLQNQWTAWLDTLSTLSIPTLPEIPVVNVSSLFVMLTVIGVSLLWLIGNGWLLRHQMK